MGEQTDELYRRLTRIENALRWLIKHHERRNTVFVTEDRIENIFDGKEID